MRPWPPAGSPSLATAGSLSSPVSTTMRSRNVPSGSRIGLSAKPAPVSAGVQLFITAPIGT